MVVVVVVAVVVAVGSLLDESERLLMLFPLPLLLLLLLLTFVELEVMTMGVGWSACVGANSFLCDCKKFKLKLTNIVTKECDSFSRHIRRWLSSDKKTQENKADSNYSCRHT